MERRHDSFELQVDAPEGCVPVVEGTDWWRVLSKEAQRGVNGPDGCGRPGADDLSDRADAQGIDNEENEYPDKPGNAAAGRCDSVLGLVAHDKWIGAWVAAVKGRND